eukprot:TRINITY_DN46899_c0_g1_i1.p1 TRINITY_DN46899_c0_g1~~TRINITY_DN46899_c0_g1_i1.p1  ORF type:complete len:157 (+),score=40.63 TRINITY_DN46899_c0_g1_i1:59-472(+)
MVAAKTLLRAHGWLETAAGLTFLAAPWLVTYDYGTWGSVALSNREADTETICVFLRLWAMAILCMGYQSLQAAKEPLGEAARGILQAGALYHLSIPVVVPWAVSRGCVPPSWALGIPPHLVLGTLMARACAAKEKSA